MEIENTRKGYIMALTLVATLGGLLFGYDTAVISGAVKSLQAYFIDSLRDNEITAARVIWQYHLTVILVIYGITLAIGAILLKLFGKTRGIIISIFLILITSGLLYYFMGRGEVFNEEIASSLKGFTISSALVGCILGGATGGIISKRAGRRNGLIIAAILFTISAIGSALPDLMNIFFVEDIISFIIYRIIGGVGVGLASMLSPMYIAEIAPPENRGQLVSWNQFAIISGMVMVYFINYFIALQGDDQWLSVMGWRWMLGSETLPALVFLVLLFLVPETPRYLVMRNRDDKALDLLKKLGMGEERSGRVLSEIRDTLKEKDAPWLSYGGTLIVTGILLSIFQQFVGINVVLYYAPEIFRNMGNQTDTSLLQTIIVGTVNLFFTLVAIYTVDRFGRKPLQVIGALGMAISMFGIGFTFYFERLGIGALLFMLAYTASFAVSWGPVTWVLLSEIFPNKIRGAMSIAVAAQWIANLGISWTFPMMNDNSWLTSRFHHGFAFWIYGIMGILAAIFVLRLVPETRKKTLEEMEKLWK
ncbi:MAG TPA: D-xylose transporter XylE [Cyclobacteriaceae bacterium]|nr:D-xylose transporter XylE [Cyclobacteriaceae bacterium]